MTDPGATETPERTASERLDAQLLILDEGRTVWLPEGANIAAMDTVRTLLQGGLVPTESQQERLRAHGFKRGDNTAISASEVRKFARRVSVLR